MNLFAIFLQTLETTLPVFAMVFIGLGLRVIGWINQEFVNTASMLVFKATLPTLVFLSIIRTDLNTALNPALLIFFTGATLVRSEEHTSELQSRPHLVCRLLLEKKKKETIPQLAYCEMLN